MQVDTKSARGRDETIKDFTITGRLCYPYSFIHYLCIDSLLFTIKDVCPICDAMKICFSLKQKQK